MLESIKTYVIQIGLKKYTPMAAMAGMAALGTFMAAHAGMLEQYGITYGIWPLHWPTGQEPSGNVILVELDTLSTAAIAGVIGLVTILMQHSKDVVPKSTAVNPPQGEPK